MDIKTKINSLPKEPGCYLYKNKYGKVIYVGKAKNLRNRVKSYFSGIQNIKTSMLVSEIDDFEYVVTATEAESLLLELNLIKKHDPKYNILLKDDKSYPYILVTNHDYPRLLVTRDRNSKKGTFYGPYPDVTAARTIVDLINRTYPLVKCRIIPKQECLYFHMHQCLAPCIKDVDQTVYMQHIDEIKRILKGDISFFVKKLKADMHRYSDEMNFEKALESKQAIESIQSITQKQTIISNKNINADVINYCQVDDKICIQHFYIRNGGIIERVGEIFDVLENGEEVFIQYVLNMYYEKNLPDEIIVPNIKDIQVLQDIIPTDIKTYQKGDKANFLKMAYNNAEIVLNKYFDNKINEFNKTKYINQELFDIVNKNCYRIDMFDISHHGGVNTVGALVVAKNFEFEKKLYRKFKVSKEQNDDVNSLKEVVYRYYFRSLMDASELPDIIIADGGKLQVDAVLSVVNDLNIDIIVAGLVKDDKHRTKALYYNNNEYEFDSKSELFKFFTRLQDEVHRFAINYHHTLASKQINASKLDEIGGIGTKRKMALINHFKTIENISSATLEELEEVVPKNIAETVFNFFN